MCGAHKQLTIAHERCAHTGATRHDIFKHIADDATCQKERHAMVLVRAGGGVVKPEQHNTCTVRYTDYLTG